MLKHQNLEQFKTKIAYIVKQERKDKKQKFEKVLTRNEKGKLAEKDKICLSIGLIRLGFCDSFLR